MSGGWIKLHRDIARWGWYKDGKTKELFIHLLLFANFKEGSFKGRVIERGQLVTGRIQLAKDLGMSEQSVRTALNKLKSTSEVTIKTTSQFSVITVCNYEAYQAEDIEGNQQTNQQVNQPSTNHQPTNNQRVTTIEEGKKNKNVKKDKNINIPKKLLLNKNQIEEFNLLKKMKQAEIDYWFDEIQSAQSENPKKYLYKDYSRVVMSWRNRRLGEGLLWSDKQGIYTKKWIVDEERSVQQETTGNFDTKQAQELFHKDLEAGLIDDYNPIDYNKYNTLAKEI